MNDENKKIDPFMMDISKDFFARVTIPILYKHEEECMKQIGTGTFFNIDNRIFLVTAAHIFKEFHIYSVLIPSLKFPQDLQPIGNHKLFQEDDENVDVAVIELLDQKMIQHIEKSDWRILSLENIDYASSDGVFVLCGYPSEKEQRIKKDRIGGSLQAIYTERLPDIPPEASNPDPAIDMFFYYAREGAILYQEKITMPALQGCSGASVWEYKQMEKGKFWTHDKSMKIVGIQCSYCKGAYFRAKKWEVVLSILKKFD